MSNGTRLLGGKGDPGGDVGSLEPEAFLAKLTRPLNSFGEPVDSRPKRPDYIRLASGGSSFRSSTSNHTSLGSSGRDFAAKVETMMEVPVPGRTPIPVSVHAGGSGGTRKEAQSRKVKHARQKFAKNVNQGSKGLIKISKKTMSKLNPVQTLLRTKGKDESAYGGASVRSGRSKKSRAELDSGSGSGSGSEFVAAASSRGETFTSIQARKGSVLDQVRINVSGGNTSSYTGNSSEEENDDDDNRSSTPNRDDSTSAANSMQPSTQGKIFCG